jgi:VWFA-related protein
VCQQIEVLDIETVPVHIALVLDTSTSVEGIELVRLQAAAHGFLRGLEPKDRAGLITFTHFVKLREPLTGDIERLHRAVDRVEAGGATVWRDALFAGLKMVEPTAERPVVILFTDGKDMDSWLREDQLMPLVEQSRAVVYTTYSASDPLGFRDVQPDGSLPVWVRARLAQKLNQEERKHTKLLRELAEASGGRFLEAKAEESLEQTFLGILEEMKTRYLLTYIPSGVKEEGWHEIEVKLKKGKADIRARRGYYYETYHRTY